MTNQARSRAALVDSFKFHHRKRMAHCAHIRIRPAPTPDRVAPSRAVLSLQEARADLASGTRRYPADLEPAGWHSKPENEREARLGRRFFHLAGDLDRAGFRLVGTVTTESYGGPKCWSRKRSGTDTPDSGWFTDPHGDVFRDGTGLMWGIVAQLPGRNGQARFVAGYQQGGTDAGPTLDLGRVFSCKASDSRWDVDGADLEAARDAAYHADALAKEAAEQERDYQTAWQAGTRYAERLEEISDTRKEALALIRELKRARAARLDGFPVLCRTLLEEVRELARSIKRTRAKARVLARGDMDDLSFWTGDERLQDAFCDGAGLSKFPR